MLKVKMEIINMKKLVIWFMTWTLVGCVDNSDNNNNSEDYIQINSSLDRSYASIVVPDECFIYARDWLYSYNDKNATKPLNVEINEVTNSLQPFSNIRYIVQIQSTKYNSDELRSVLYRMTHQCYSTSYSEISRKSPKSWNQLGMEVEEMERLNIPFQSIVIQNDVIKIYFNKEKHSQKINALKEDKQKMIDELIKHNN
jgi:hypothetical protein